jgi:drug/metabolite transporter (DMT)-like permease
MLAWFPLALLTALFEALKDVVMKKSLRDVPEYLVAWSWMFFALPFLGLALLLTGLPPLGEQFWVALLLSGSLNALAISLYVRAINASDLSVTVPMIAFSPLFLLVTAPVILGELPTFWGIVGVVLVVIGAYVLNIKQRHLGYLAPYRALLRERGPKLMLAVAFIWSISATIDKIGVQNSSPVLWILSVQSFVTLVLTPAVLRRPGSAGHVRRNLPYLLLMGFCSFVVAVAQMIAITLTLVAYVISVKRTSTLLGVLFGYLFFQEGHIRERLLGAAIMLLGVFCITVL